MTAATPHPDDRIDAWIDGRLTPDERRGLDQHFAGCERCRQVRDALVASRRALRAAVDSLAPPAGLAARVRDALDREDARRASEAAQRPAAPSAPVPPSHRGPGRTRPAPRRWPVLVPVAAALAAAAVGLVWIWSGPGRPADPVGDAFASHRTLGAAELPATIRAASSGEVERRWREGGIAFPARVLDLGGMGIEVVGGDATVLGGAPAARSIYRGESGTFVCWMFEGSTASLPPPEERRRHGGFEFLIYRRGATTLVFWQEGDVVCAFAGSGDLEAVVALAFAKAMAPPAGDPV